MELKESEEKTLLHFEIMQGENIFVGQQLMQSL